MEIWIRINVAAIRTALRTAAYLGICVAGFVLGRISVVAQWF